MITFEDWCALGLNPRKYDRWVGVRTPVTLDLTYDDHIVEAWFQEGPAQWPDGWTRIGHFEDPSRAELAAVTLRLSL